jgi:FkbM family methyltransferase
MMRLELLWNPGLACERLAYQVRQRRRLKKLRGTPAEGLQVGHIESLELLEAAASVGIETIYDIGANVGTWSLLAKAIFPHSRIEAFEPLQRHRQEFETRLASQAGVTVHQTALGSENKSMMLRITDFSDASSLLPLAPESRKEFGLKEVDSVEVPVSRLDDLRQKKSLPFPDLIKLDVQGWELEVLKGAPESLAHAKAIIAEVSFREYYERQCLFHELVHHLADAGLFLAMLGEHTQKGVPLRQADVLFLRKHPGL